MEQQLSLAVSAGEPIDLGGQQLDVAVLRRLITGQTAECTVTPFGVRIRNGELRGRLDLEGADVPFPLALTRISMIGNEMELDRGVGMCGKNGQSVPVGVGQPSVKIDRLTVGGAG